MFRNWHAPSAPSRALSIQAPYRNLVAAAIAEAPGKPGARRQDIVVTDEIRKRTLTTAADAAVP